MSSVSAGRAIVCAAIVLSLLFRPATILAQCTPLGCDHPVSGSITAQGAVKCFSFSVSDGEVVEIGFVTEENEDGQPQRATR